MIDIREGDILDGPFWEEKVRVISVKRLSDARVKLEAEGLQSNTLYKPILKLEDLERVKIERERTLSFDACGEAVFLYLEALRIKNAYQFDPLYAVNVSQVDPLPHQIEAVYHYMLKGPRIRFLLADDPGAGKTIMAGLLIKELKYRGLAEKILIVTPGHLKDQWIREMKEKFQENFSVVTRDTINSEWGKNAFNERNQVIISIDFAKQEDVIEALRDTKWDLCIVDEAHKMAAYMYGEKVKKTQRYRLGEVLSSISSSMLFLTATPHRGDPENFRLLLDLLEPGFFADKGMLEESIQNKDNPLFLRRLKEDLKDFNNRPLFPPRRVHTIKYYLSEDEKELYNAVTDYVEKHFNKAMDKKKRNVAFALTILQRRLASSVRAVRMSLERRYKRLKELYQKAMEDLRISQEANYDESILEDLEEEERWKIEDEMVEKLTSAETLPELEMEIKKLEELLDLAKKVERKEVEAKLKELKRVMENENLQQSGTKLLIFTEFKDTLDYLVEKLKKWGYSVAYIHGGMNLEQRIQAESDFRHGAQIMVSTEAGGEGINLQFCWLMVNYDIPWNPNRLEQRMGRIHRYGQRHEVHIYNLVAVDTREGKILNKLFEKLEQIQIHLGSDRVFDVVGEVLYSNKKSLEELILEVIANPKTMDEILQSIENIPNEQVLNRVKELTLEALATRHIDLTKIVGEQRQAKENRLAPEYIEEFFKRAAKRLGIEMKERHDGVWQIQFVPYELRNQPHEFKIKYGEVLREYSKVSFDKEKAFKLQVEFVSAGHPLLEAVIKEITTKHAQDALNGAFFEDPEGKRDGLIWFLEAQIRDGSRELVGKKLFAVYQALTPTNGSREFSFISPAVLWDLKPLPADQQAKDIPDNALDTDAVVEFVIINALDSYKRELLEIRQRETQIKEKYGVKSLEHMILKSEEKLIEYEERKLRGEIVPDVTIQNEERRKRELQEKLENLKKKIKAEMHLYYEEPKLLGVVRVIPSVKNTQMSENQEIERLGMEFVMEYERKEGRIPEDVSSQNLGYDIRSRDSQGNYRYIEVKARFTEGEIVLTPNEWMMAHRLKDEYWLYVVTYAASKPKLHCIQNPASKLKPNEIMGVVRYIVNDWKKYAEAKA